ncbi:MAG: hypothetical protein ACLFVJ_20485, partial [Persicimonas sp.]
MGCEDFGHHAKAEGLPRDGVNLPLLLPGHRFLRTLYLLALLDLGALLALLDLGALLALLDLRRTTLALLDL